MNDENHEHNDSLNELFTRQRHWSVRTFGPPRGITGVFEHIREELAEIEEDPSDIEEWADLFILAIDAAWRSGFDGLQIHQAVRRKQEKNAMRLWPKWEDADPTKPINHVREE